MRNELVIDLMGHLGKSHQFQAGSAGREVEAKIESMVLPMDVKRLLQWRWPLSHAVVGPYSLYPAEHVTTIEDLDRFLKSSMVPIGAARNGDILVILFDERHEEIGLVSHDELWEGEGPPSDCFVPVCRSVDEYLWRVSEGRYLPRDFFAAREWQQLKEEAEGGRHGV